jgi:hypothetical protein
MTKEKKAPVDLATDGRSLREKGTLQKVQRLFEAL